MPRNKRERLKIRNASIAEAFSKLVSIKDGNVQKYSMDYILKKIADRFFLEPETILKIVKEQSN